MTEAVPETRHRGPFGLVLQAERIAREYGPRRRTVFDPEGALTLPILLRRNAWLSFDLELERWWIRRPDGRLFTTRSVVLATLEVARLLERTATDEVVEQWTRWLLASQRRSG